MQYQLQLEVICVNSLYIYMVDSPLNLIPVPSEYILWLEIILDSFIVCDEDHLSSILYQEDDMLSWDS
jgi:hypothetical protein